MNKSVLMGNSSLQLQSSYIDVEKQSSAFKTTSFTFGKESRKLNETKIDKLGPGSYYQEKTHEKRMRAISFAKSERSTIISEMPPSSSVGPGNYQVNETFTKILPKSSSVSVMKSKRFTEVRDSSPGPGHYENDSVYIKQRDPKWSLSKQVRDLYVVKETLPGPGVYNVNSSFGSGKKVNINFDGLDFNKRETKISRH
jgi:hypothetical protein